MYKNFKITQAVLAVLLVNSILGCSQKEDKKTSSAQEIRITIPFSANDQCPNGGLKYWSGLDENENGMLETSERDSKKAHTQCS